MTEPTDEMLMAYADGQLSSSERSRIEAYLGSNPNGRERLQVFIDTGPVLARALDAATAGPVPGWIVETVKRHRPLPGRVESARPAKNRWWSLSTREEASFWPLAAVACASLVVGFGIGRQLFQVGGASTGSLVVAADHQGGLVAAAPLRHVLETARSGAISALEPGSGGLQATPVLSFKSRQAGVCRQYRVTSTATAAGEASEGLACRQPEGQWRIEIHAVAEARQTPSGSMAPAAGPGSSPVDAVVDRIIDGDPLGADDELRLLDNRWQVDRPKGAAR